MSGFIKTLKRKGKEAAEDVSEALTSPFEVKELEEINKDLLKEADEQIASHNTPLQKEEATAIEQGIFNAILEKYDRKAHKKLKRNASSDNNDNINVYKRKLQRGLDSRAGKIYGKFANEVTALNDAAANTLRSVVETLAEFDNFAKSRLPLLVEDLDRDIASTFASITDQVQNSFPGGVAGIDAYDDHLPDGIPSWVNFQAQFEATATALRELNTVRIQESRAKALEILTEAQNRVRNLESSLTARFPLLPATLNNDLDNSLAEINNYVESSFPGGLEKLDLYDDDLPEGIPSWANLLVVVGDISGNLVSANNAAIAADLQAKKATTYNNFVAAVDALLASSNESVDGLSLDYLTEEERVNFQNSLKEQTKQAQQSVVNVLTL
eukprot:CAMPEP_0174821816 /NCGR_PEP_ID=MMETSP1107-20130205/9845_1 /TAXON_ID=36770 /ORGANISM="Paraphysomonas vestita, Strain GFlagA" /LENGTH=383 /DNA_ID=CAMNT_0016039239 /DNA_START=52 /DNA_END=1203 /DNA_ORIENTATION=-